MIIFITIFSGGLSGRVGMSKRLSASLFLCCDVFSHHSTYCEAGWSCMAGTSSSHSEAIKRSVGVLAEFNGTKQYKQYKLKLYGAYNYDKGLALHQWCRHLLLGRIEKSLVQAVDSHIWKKRRKTSSESILIKLPSGKPLNLCLGPLFKLSLK